MSNRSRFLYLLSGLAILFAILGLRFYQIQILEGEKWGEIALSQHQTLWKEPPMRGTIYAQCSLRDKHPTKPQPLVVDIPKYHLFIDPLSLPRELHAHLVEKLGKTLSLSSRQKGEIAKALLKKSHSRKIGRFLELSQKKSIESWWYPLAKEHKIAKNALFFGKDYQRSYPFGPLLGSVLHTVQGERDPKTGHAIPTGGIELAYNTLLQGQEGKTVFTRSLRHILGMGEVLEERENGADIYLTIDPYLQAILEEELQKGVQVAKAKGGWAVLLDPHSGEIWALAQVPSLDPRRYAEFFEKQGDLSATKVQAVTECFEPGSIFKPLTMAVGLLANQECAKRGLPPVFSPEEKIATSNGMFPGRSAPLREIHVHRYLNMDMAIQKSSNIYMAKVAHKVVERLGEAWYRKMLHDGFGLGKKCGVEIPAEAVGLLPTPGKLHPNGKLEWSASTPASLAIGHNILVHSVQIAAAYATLANGGFRVSPHLVRSIQKGSEVLVFKDPHALKERVLPESIAKRVVRSMKFVRNQAQALGYTTAGKSGTAEKLLEGRYSKDKNIASFAGFAPVDQPRLVVVVSIDEPAKEFVPGLGSRQFGGVSAGPVFRAVATRTLEYLGIAPDDPGSLPKGDPRKTTDAKKWNEERAALDALYQSWNGK